MPDTSSQTARHTQCSLCSQLADIERGLQVVGREEEDTFVPAIAGNMVFIKSLKPTNSRTLQLQQCSECSTYYLYSTDYE